MADHDGCRGFLLAMWAAVHDLGEDLIDITVSAAPPLVASQWTRGYVCPHGITYYIEPTGEQRARWAAEARHT